jgi:hypothetical protein
MTFLSYHFLVAYTKANACTFKSSNGEMLAIRLNKTTGNSNKQYMSFLQVKQSTRDQSASINGSRITKYLHLVMNTVHFQNSQGLMHLKP